jgi:hypothetical protein
MTSTHAVRRQHGEADGVGLVRLLVRFDAVVTGAFGLGLLAGGAVLDGPLGISAELLVPVGVVLAAYAAVLWLGIARRLSRVAVLAVVALNLLWAIGSVVAVAAGWLSASTLGNVLVLGQAAAVALLADVQWLALRRSRL